jgi:hypothetical protein
MYTRTMSVPKIWHFSNFSFEAECGISLYSVQLSILFSTAFALVQHLIIVIFFLSDEMQTGSSISLKAGPCAVLFAFPQG